jgi:hypothetical protein
VRRQPFEFSLSFSRNREQEREKSEKKEPLLVVVYNVLAFGKEKSLLSLSLSRERVLRLCSNSDEF